MRNELLDPFPAVFTLVRNDVRRATVRINWLSVAAFGFLASGVEACHNASSRAAPIQTASAPLGPAGPVLPAGHAFGDSTRHAINFLSFDKMAETANLFIRDANHVIVLAVVPGREIELIFPGNMTLKKLGHNEYQFAMQRIELVGREPAPEDAGFNRRAYEQCVRNRTAAQRAEKAAQARRDASGRAVQAESSASRSDNINCDLMPEVSAKPSYNRKRLPPRPLADRYLVVLSSTQRIELLELNQRLSTLTTVAPDVALTIEAIAAGIYAGAPGTWGGAYIPW